MGFNPAAGFAAGGGADALMEIIRQKLAQQEVDQRNQHALAKLAEDARQADQRNTIDQGQLGLGRDRLGLDSQKLGEDTRQFDVSAGQRDRGLKLDEEIQPVRIANVKAQTADVQRRPQAEQEARDFTAGRDKTQHGYQMREIGARQAPAGDDSGQFTSVQQVVGPDGKPAFAIIDRRNGTMKPVQNPAGFEPNRPARPVTGSERQTLNFFNRMLEAERNARSVEDKVSGTDLAASEMAPGFIENWLKSKEGQQYSQAQRTYTEARLRKESGAAIPPNEFDSDRRTNFRAMGDKPEALTQKRGSRLQTLKGIGNASGRALQEYYGEGATLDDLLKEFAEAKAAAPSGGGGRVYYDANGNPVKR